MDVPVPLIHHLEPPDILGDDLAPALGELE